MSLLPLSTGPRVPQELCSLLVASARFQKCVSFLTFLSVWELADRTWPTRLSLCVSPPGISPWTGPWLQSRVTSQWSKLGVSTLLLMDQTRPTVWFCKESFIRTSAMFICFYIVYGCVQDTMSELNSHHRDYMAHKPAIFTSWPFTERVCWPLS